MKTFLKVLKYLFYVCSFPLFLVFTILASLNNIKQGGSYGFLTYASILLPIVFTAIWVAMVVVQEVKLHKPGVKNVPKKIRKQTCKQVAFSLLLSCGLMFALDALIPAIFPSLASYTIYYEDIAEEDAANIRADLNKSMLDAIIARSVLTGIIGDKDGNGYTQYYTYYKTSEKDLNGNATGPYTGRVVDASGNPLVLCKYGYYVKDTLNTKESAYTLEGGDPVTPAVKSDEEIEEMNKFFNNLIQYYIGQGMKNNEVKSIMNPEGSKNLKASINLSGYESWCGPWVDLANDNRMTIPVILNLILGQRKAVQTTEVYGTQLITDTETRETVDELYDYPWYNPTTCKVETLKISWTVLDMMGDGYSYDPDNLTGTSSALQVALTDGSLWNVVTDLEIGNISVKGLLESLGLVEYNTDGSVKSSVLTESKSILGIIEIPALYYALDSILTTVTYAVGTPTVAGTPTYDADGNLVSESGWMSGFAPLYLKLENADGSTVGTVKNGSGENVYYISSIGDAPTQLGVYSSNYSKGTIDYMRFMWVDSNSLIFAITGLFAIRKTCYIFSAIICLLAIAIGVIRMKLYRMESGTGAVVEVEPKKDEENNDSDSMSVNMDMSAPETESIQKDAPAEEATIGNPYDMNDNSSFESTTFYNN